MTPRVPARMIIISATQQKDAAGDPWVFVEFDITPRAHDSDGVMYTAAAPAERRASADGSCLPFATERHALERTPSRGFAERKGLHYTARFRLPNSYYTGMSATLVPPSLHVSYLVSDGGRARGRAKVAEPTPFRSLTHPTLRYELGAGFYDAGPDATAVRSQDAILAVSAYPSPSGPPHGPSPATAPQFWGGRPPC
jgi:hypothetical protein